MLKSPTERHREAYKGLPELDRLKLENAMLRGKYADLEQQIETMRARHYHDYDYLLEQIRKEKDGTS